MRIPSDAIIPRDKLTRYLLVPRRRNDKSRYLAQAGFTEQNPDFLDLAIRRHAAEHDAVFDRKDEYGDFYRVDGNLYGLDTTLSVTTIWLRQTPDAPFRFITLKPLR